MKIAGLLIVGLLCFLAAWAFWFEPASIRVVRHELDIPALSRKCSGLKIAILSDLHVGSPFNGLNELARIVAKTNEVRPHLILLPGDFVIHSVLGGKFVTPEAAAAVLEDLNAPLGTYAVLGNHDWWLDAKRVQTALEAHRIPVLEDRSINIIGDLCAFALVGVSDYWEGPHDVRRALENVEDTQTTIVFTHNPDVFPTIPKSVELTIAGHTHGGQVYIPGIGRPIVPSEYGERFAIGHIEEDDRHLFVSTGVGTSIIPVRFLVPPEISLVIVK